MNAKHTTYHPKWYRERMPIFWWLRRWNYTLFITRELTSLAVAYTALLLLFQVRAVRLGADAYRRFLEWERRPAVLALHVLVFVLLVVHTVTWLNLAPRAMVVRPFGRRVPDAAVLLGHYAAWLLVSLLLAFILIGHRP